MYKILIVEDDKTIANAVKKHVETWGYQAYATQNFQNVMEDFAREHPQLVILDITLPFYNGYHWCSEIRKVSKVPILFLSSAADNMNIIMAMQMGGDDTMGGGMDTMVPMEPEPTGVPVWVWIVVGVGVVAAVVMGLVVLKKKKAKRRAAQLMEDDDEDI